MIIFITLYEKCLSNLSPTHIKPASGLHFNQYLPKSLILASLHLRFQREHACSETDNDEVLHSKSAFPFHTKKVFCKLSFIIVSLLAK